MSQKLILDTSLFVNPAAAHYFGNSPTQAFSRFLQLAELVKDVEFYMPPSIYQELMHFAEETKIPAKLLLLIHKKAPPKNEMKVPGIFVYQLVESFRDRSDRGLRSAERCVREAFLIPAPPKEAGHPKGPQPDAEIIGSLRDSYRRIMRENMLDSKADVDLLLLTYELQGTLVSADQGVLDWGENLGLSFMNFEHLKDFLEKNLSQGKPQFPGE